MISFTMQRTTSSLILFILLSIPIFAQAQQKDWKETTANDGKVKLKHTVNVVKDKKGDNRVVGEYILKTTANIKLGKAEKLFRNADKYKDFLDNTEVSKNVGNTSKNDWLLYLFIDAPWPMPNADCVQRVTIARTEKELTVNCIAKPDAYPLQGEERMDISDSKFHFVENASGAVEVTITGKFSPMGPITKFLLETWFPKGPVDLLERILDKVNAQ